MAQMDILRLCIIAINVFLIYLYNGDWKPDWNSNEHKYNIMRTREYGITSCSSYNEGAIYFKNKEDAQAVIDNPNFRSILDAIYKD